MNPYTVSGLFAGAVLGFFVGRRFAEYHRAERDVANIRAGQKGYRGTNRAIVAGVLLFVIGVMLFGVLSPV